MTIPLVALLMLVFLLMATLVVDLGLAYTARTSAQHAADAAALAGAVTFRNTALSGDELVATATRAAAAVANASKVLNYPVNVSSAIQAANACDTGTNIICVDETKKRVTAVVGSPVDTYFGKIAGFDLLNVKVKAVAEAAQNAIGDLCLKPFYIANDAISPVVPPSSETPQQRAQRCQNAKDAGTTILDPQDPTKLSAYATSYIQAQKNFTTYVTNPAGCQGTSGCPFSFWTPYTPNPSQYGVIDFTEDQSNAEQVLACSISSCMQECPTSRKLYACGEPVAELKTGRTSGQIATQLMTYTGQGTTPNNLYVDVGTYDNSPGGVQSTSPSLISVIIWDCTAAIPDGTQPTVTVVGNALVFLNKVASNRNDTPTNAFLINASGCTGGGSSSGGPVDIPIRLVNTSQ